VPAPHVYSSRDDFPSLGSPGAPGGGAGSSQARNPNNDIGCPQTGFDADFPARAGAPCATLVRCRPVQAELARLPRLPVRLAIVAATALLIAIVPAAVGADSSSMREQASALRRDNVSISAHSHTAVLTLYALDSKLSRVRGELAALDAKARSVRAERAAARRHLRVARHVLTVSQRRLAARLRLLYEQGDTDALAVVLGAKSLDDALSALDGITFAAKEDRKVIAATTLSRRRLVRLTASLARREAELRQLAAQKRSELSTLASARADRAAYLAQLASQRRLNSAQIGSLEGRAEAIDAAAKRLALARTAAAQPVGAAPAPIGVGSGTMTVVATGYALPGQTATGAPTGWGVVAVDPAVIPLGTRMSIPGYGEGVAADTGGAVRGATIDLWFPSTSQAAAWGRRTVTISLH
jgi:3D (Asp-Asp-Asp) domain-containing protein/peptidoglycan hydrolase CwlO-like protein